MKSILNIIHTLKKSDIQFIKMYLKNTNKSDKKLKLFKLIEKDKLIDESAASILLYGKVTNNIRKLKERLLQDIEDVLVIRLNKNNTDNAYNKNEINAISLLLHAQYYLKNGLLAETNKKLKKVKKIIEEHNFVFLSSTYYQISCEYLEQINGSGIEEELVESINNLKELKHIQLLKLTNSWVDSQQSKSPQNSKLKSENVFGFYSTCLKKLTQLKLLICSNELTKAEFIYDSLYEETTYNMNQVPLVLYVEILLQKIKINILKKSYAANEDLFTNIKSLCFNSEKLSNDFLELRFINNFLLEQYDHCKNIVFYFFTDKNIKSNLSSNIVNRWKYFDICLSFMKKEYKNVIELINQLPSQSSAVPRMQINVRILEYYSLLLLNDDGLILKNYNSIRKLFNQLDNRSITRYEYVLERIINLSEIQAGNLTYNRDSNIMRLTNDFISPAQDILGFELIPIELIEDKIVCKNKRLQYVI